MAVLPATLRKCHDGTCQVSSASDVNQRWAWANIPHYRRQLASPFGEAELFGPRCDLSRDCSQREERGICMRWVKDTHRPH